MTNDTIVVYSLFYPSENAYSPIKPLLRKEEALESAMSDPAYLHAALVHIAKTLRDQTTLELGPSITYHLCKAISIINKRIASNKVVSIDTIGAVTSLTGYEVCNFRFFLLNTEQGLFPTHHS
jgi:hypothetical protein